MSEMLFTAPLPGSNCALLLKQQLQRKITEELNKIDVPSNRHQDPQLGQVLVTPFSIAFEDNLSSTSDEIEWPYPNPSSFDTFEKVAEAHRTSEWRQILFMNSHHWSNPKLGVEITSHSGRQIKTLKSKHDHKCLSIFQYLSNGQELKEIFDLLKSKSLHTNYASSNSWLYNWTHCVVRSLLWGDKDQQEHLTKFYLENADEQMLAHTRQKGLLYAINIYFHGTENDTGQQSAMISSMLADFAHFLFGGHSNYEQFSSNNQYRQSISDQEMQSTEYTQIVQPMIEATTHNLHTISSNPLLQKFVLDSQLYGPDYFIENSSKSQHHARQILTQENLTPAKTEDFIETIYYSNLLFIEKIYSKNGRSIFPIVSNDEPGRKHKLEKNLLNTLFSNWKALQKQLPDPLKIPLVWPYLVTESGILTRRRNHLLYDLNQRDVVDAAHYLKKACDHSYKTNFSIRALQVNQSFLFLRQLAEVQTNIEENFSLPEKDFISVNEEFVGKYVTQMIRNTLNDMQPYFLNDNNQLVLQSIADTDHEILITPPSTSAQYSYSISLWLDGQSPLDALIKHAKSFPDLDYSYLNTLKSFCIKKILMRDTHLAASQNTSGSTLDSPRRTKKISPRL